MTKGMDGTQSTGVETGREGPGRSSPPAAAEVRPLHEQFWRALQAEVKATRKQDRQQAVPVGPGQREKGEGDEGRYVFEPATTSHALSAGDRVACELGDGCWKGQVVDANAELAVELDRSCGRHTPPGRIRPDTAWLTAVIRDRIAETMRALQANRDPTPPFHYDLALRALGKRALRPGTGQPPKAVLEEEPPLNEEQLLAVRHSLGSDVQLLWGPPGTGKSTVLSRIVEAHHREGRSVLIVAASNAAVDILTRHLVERYGSGLELGQLLRVGPGVTDRLPEEMRRQVRPEQVARRVKTRREREEADLARRLEYVRERRPALLRTLRNRISGVLASIAPDYVVRRLASPARRLRRRRQELLEQPVPDSYDLQASTDIVATTAHQVMLNPALGRLFDVVVVDEAIKSDLLCK